MPVTQTYRGVVRKGQIQLKPPARLTEGSEVTVIVTAAEPPPTSSPVGLYVNPARPAMEREQAALQAMLPQLLVQYEGQYVALHQGQVVDHDADRTALVIRLDQTHPDEVVLGNGRSGAPAAYTFPTESLYGWLLFDHKITSRFA